MTKFACPPKGKASARVGNTSARMPERRMVFFISLLYAIAYAILLSMEWFRTHPYTSALCAAGVLTLIGAFIVASRASEPATTQVTAWGGGAVSLLDPTAGAPAEDSSLRDTSKLP